MVFLGLGSNLQSDFGDRYKNIELAINYLRENNINLLQKSSFYESVSYPNKNDPKFINVVIEIDTHLKPEDLASSIISIEKKLKRKRVNKNEPRTCDIDIIDFKGKIKWDTSKPNGQPRRKVSNKLAEEKLGFKAETALEQGLRKTIEWYQKNYSN